MTTSSPIFERTLVQGPHVRSFHVDRIPSEGWVASEEADSRVVRCDKYTDWHRVERAVSRFSGEVAELRRHGWLDRSAVPPPAQLTY